MWHQAKSGLIWHQENVRRAARASEMSTVSNVCRSCCSAHERNLARRAHVLYTCVRRRGTGGTPRSLHMETHTLFDLVLPFCIRALVCVFVHLRACLCLCLSVCVGDCKVWWIKTSDRILSVHQQCCTSQGAILEGKIENYMHMQTYSSSYRSLFNRDASTCHFQSLKLLLPPSWPHVVLCLWALTHNDERNPPSQPLPRPLPALLNSLKSSPGILPR